MHAVEEGKTIAAPKMYCPTKKTSGTTGEKKGAGTSNLMDGRVNDLLTGTSDEEGTNRPSPRGFFPSPQGDVQKK